MGLHGRSTAAGAVAALAVMSASLVAAEAHAAEPANLTYAPAPSQFVAFCERLPAECAAEGISASSAKVQTPYATAAGAARFNWSYAFSSPASRKGAPAPRERATAAAFSDLDRLSKINRQVNRSVRFRTDAALFGVNDVWTLPTAGKDGLLYGDCEDYALQKRKILMAEGFAPEALSLAVVRTGRGEVHAVLLVNTEAGEMMMDSLTSFVVPWARSAYTLIARQVAGEPGAWAQPA